MAEHTPLHHGSTWGNHRRRVRLFQLTLLAGPVIILLLLETPSFKQFGLHALIWPTLFWLGLLLLAGLYWQHFLCPRCERRFYRSHPPLLPLRARSCRSCMLPRD